jgi:hypothetical protein
MTNPVSSVGTFDRNRKRKRPVVKTDKEKPIIYHPHSIIISTQQASDPKFCQKLAQIFGQDLDICGVKYRYKSE